MNAEHAIAEGIGYALLGLLGVVCLFIAGATTFCLIRSDDR